MRIRWSRPAIRDLVEIHAYIEQDNPAAATSVARAVVAAVERLADYPSSGRPGRVPETRELVVPGTPYAIPYRVTGDVVEIIAVLHGARKPPDAP